MRFPVVSKENPHLRIVAGSPCSHTCEKDHAIDAGISMEASPMEAEAPFLRSWLTNEKELRSYLVRFTERFEDQLEYLESSRTTLLHPLRADTASGVTTGSVSNRTLLKIRGLLAQDLKDLSCSQPDRRFDQVDRGIVYQRKRGSLKGAKVARLQRLLWKDPFFADWVRRFQFELHSFTLHVSRPEDSMHYQLGRWREKDFRAENLPHQKFLQLHYDPDADNIKSILYLSGVNSENCGPFEYVENSNKVSSDNVLQRAAGAAMCGTTLLETGPGVMFFRSLPAEIRQHNIIGSLLTTEEIRSFLVDSGLKEGRQLLGDAGTACIFDPIGLHRGGYCSGDGRRENLQLIFKRKR